MKLCVKHGTKCLANRQALLFLRFVFLAGIFCTIMVNLNRLYRRSPPPIMRANGTEPKRSRLILLWTPLFPGWDFLSEGVDCFGQCPVYDCEMTLDRSRLLESDAVVFHARTMSLLDIPNRRKEGQKWVFFSLESPPHSHFAGFPFMRGMFNWTMTYRSDSDVVIRYGSAVRTTSAKDTRQPMTMSAWKGKSKMAVWMVSHCDTSGGREDYVKELQHFMDVDIFGGCGLGSCPHNQTDECLLNFSKNYYFYLAFENSICSDYVTEKFFKALSLDMVPVVFGGGNYSEVAPDRSYVDALAFSSPKYLARHLRRVARDFRNYAPYFEWKRRGHDIRDRPSHCGLCEKLHSKYFSDYSGYSDINRWWIEGSHCKRWTSS